VSRFLTKQERKALEQELRLERYARFSDRIKCILLLDSGKTSESIAEYLFLSGNTVTNYLKKYQTGGLEDLVSDDYQGSECRLSKVQQQKLARHLEETLYQTVSSIREHIKVTYNVTYSLSGLRHLLRRLDFVYKKPKAIPGKADKVAQEEFLRLIEAKLAENRRETVVYYADGTHPQHNTHCAHGWIKRGQNKEIKTNSGRQRVNINGVVNAHDPTDVVIEESSSINAQSTIALLKKLEQKNNSLRCIFVVADNARYYRNRQVKAFLETSKVKIIFLPPYSPNLNLIERLWRFLKKIVLYNRYYERFADFKAAILSFFANIKQYRPELESLMTL
jgi:transposase